MCHDEIDDPRSHGYYHLLDSFEDHTHALVAYNYQ